MAKNCQKNNEKCAFFDVLTLFQKPRFSIANILDEVDDEEEEVDVEDDVEIEIKTPEKTHRGRPKIGAKMKVRSMDFLIYQ